MKELGINLLKVQQSLTPYELSGLSRIKMISIGFLVVLLVFGLFVGLAFVVALQRINNLQAEKTIVSRKLTLSTRKEVLLLSLKERLPITEKTLKSQYPWTLIMNSIKSVAVPPTLSGLSIDEQNNLTINLSASSLEEINDVVGKVTQLVMDQTIKEPIINALTLDDTGLIKASIQFTPVF